MFCLPRPVPAHARPVCVTGGTGGLLVRLPRPRSPLSCTDPTSQNCSLCGSRWAQPQKTAEAVENQLWPRASLRNPTAVQRVGGLTRGRVTRSDRSTSAPGQTGQFCYTTLKAPNRAFRGRRRWTVSDRRGVSAASGQPADLPRTARHAQTPQRALLLVLTEWPAWHFRPDLVFLHDGELARGPCTILPQVKASGFRAQPGPPTRTQQAVRTGTRRSFCFRSYSFLRCGPRPAGQGSGRLAAYPRPTRGARVAARNLGSSKGQG